MPLGLWKSKWEIHREDMARYREESERRSAEHHAKMERDREKTERFFEEMRAERVKSDERWIEVREECRELRAQHDVELAEQEVDQGSARADRRDREEHRGPLQDDVQGDGRVAQGGPREHRQRQGARPKPSSSFSIASERPVNRRPEVRD